MPKSLNLFPDEVRASNTIHFKDIQVNQYKKTVKDERGRYSDEDLKKVYRDMAYIREFESMINELKTAGGYRDIPYNYPGPAHLGIGQEAAFVGYAYHMTEDDICWSSHRGHGEILAKCLRLSETMDEEALRTAMTTFFDGSGYRTIDGDSRDVRHSTVLFSLYTLLAEILSRKNSFTGGWSGGHAMFKPFGIYPTNALVGGNADLSVGSALYKLINKKKGVAVALLGDGCMSCGPVWESISMATMDQYKTLWGEHGGGVPLIYNVFNNLYAMGGQTNGETLGVGNVSRIGAGVCPNQMHAETVDGFNPLAVMDAYERILPIAKNEGPVLLEIMTYRFSGHSVSDSNAYRSKEEMDAWRAQDPLVVYPQQLIEAGVATQEECDNILAQVREDMLYIYKIAINPEVTKMLDMKGSESDAIEKIMFSNQHIPNLEVGRKPDMLVPMEESVRLNQIAKKARFGRNGAGKDLPKSRVYQVRDGIAEPILRKFYEDPTLVFFGEDVCDWGGSFAVSRDFNQAVPRHRLFNTPIAEAAIVGTGVGYAMAGGRAIVEMMYADFCGRAADELFNQLSKWQSISFGAVKMPVIVRMCIGAKYGPQHSQEWSSLFSHIPGLKVVYPATPYDAKGLMTAALNGTDPVIFMESQRIYDMGELFHEGGVPTEDYEIKIGEPDVKRVGEDVTILSIGATLYRAVEAADTLQNKYGISAEIIDARSIVPFCYDKVVESVKKTGRIVIVGDAVERSSFMRQLASTITELCFGYLDAAPVVVGSRNWIAPMVENEKSYFPQPSWIMDAIHQRIMPLPGYVPEQNFTDLELMRRNSLGL